MITEIKGDIIKFDEAQYLAHQCNCLSLLGKGLAESIFNNFPWANIYANRDINLDPRHMPTGEGPGDIIICGNGKEQRYVINMLAQVYPGKPKYVFGELDGTNVRKSYFKSCLNKISRIKNLRSISFPYGIGCGLAGGDWETYYEMIYHLDALLRNRVEIYLVKKD